MRKRIVPALAAFFVLLTLLGWRQSRATLREHRETCARFAREHGRGVTGLCTLDAVQPVLPRFAKARDTLAKEGVAAVPRVLDEAEALDREPSFVGSLVATALFEQALTLLDAPANAGAREALLAGRRLRGNDEVLEAWRLEIETRADAVPPRERIEVAVGQWVVESWLQPSATLHGLDAAAVRERMARRAKTIARLRAMQRA